MSTAKTRATHLSEACVQCGAPAARAVPGVVRTTVVVYCSAGCRDEHVAALALASRLCAAPGCDLDAAADVPYCDEHLDPAVPAPGRGGRGSRAA